MRDQDRPQHDAPRRRGLPLRRARARRHGRRPRADPRLRATSGLATRILAELGAQVVKTYYCDEGFEEVTAGCPVPDRHGRRQEAARARRADDGLSGGPGGRGRRRHGPQHLPVRAPAAMLEAVRMVVHDDVPPEQALRAFLETRRERGIRAIATVGAVLRPHVMGDERPASTSSGDGPVLSVGHHDRRPRRTSPTSWRSSSEAARASSMSTSWTASSAR